MKKLKLISVDGTSTIEGEFGPGGLLFLSSSPDGLCLSKEVREGQIAYIAFSKIGRKIFAAPAHQAASIGGEKKSGQALPGAKISLGAKVFLIERGTRGRVGKRYLLPLIIAATVAVSTAAFLSQTKRAPNAVTVAAKNPVEINLAPDKLLDEARGFLREGSVAQARLALMAAREAAPADERVLKLIAEIDRGFAAAAENENGPRADEAYEFFKEGQRLEVAGDHLGARKAFDRALSILSKSKITPPFAAALGDASRQNMKTVADELGPKLASIRAQIDSANGMSAAEAARKIRAARIAFSEMFEAMPKDSGVAELKKLLDSAVKAVSSRWIAAAHTAERLSGCDKALAMYEAITKEIGDMEPATLQDAEEGALRCRGIKTNSKLDTRLLSSGHVLHARYGL